MSLSKIVTGFKKTFHIKPKPPEDIEAKLTQLLHQCETNPTSKNAKEYLSVVTKYSAEYNLGNHPKLAQSFANYFLVDRSKK